MEVVTFTMTDTDVIGVASRAIWTALQLAGPILLVGLVVGLTISVFQAVTQIQEQTLTFIPKILAIVVVIFVAGPWMLNVLTGFTEELYRQIPEMVAKR